MRGNALGQPGRGRGLRAADTQRHLASALHLAVQRDERTKAPGGGVGPCLEASLETGVDHRQRHRLLRGAGHGAR